MDHILNGENNWLDYDRSRNGWVGGGGGGGWGANYYSWGMPMAGPMYWGNAPGAQKKGKRKGGNVHTDGQIKDKTRRGGLC